MSFEPVTWATKHAPIASTTEYAVLVAYSIHANSGGYNTYPSYPTVAEYTRLTPDTVKETVRALIRRKLMERGDQAVVAHIPGNARPINYNLRIPASFYSDLAALNRELKGMGCPPVTPENRPPIGAAPPKKQRADAKANKDRGGVAPSPGGGYNTPPNFSGNFSGNFGGNCACGA